MIRTPSVQDYARMTDQAREAAVALVTAITVHAEEEAVRRLTPAVAEAAFRRDAEKWRTHAAHRWHDTPEQQRARCDAALADAYRDHHGAAA